MDHTLTYTLYIDYLYILYYLHLQLWQSHRNRIQKQPPEVFLKIWQISQENTCVRVSFLSLQACNVIKKRLLHRCFPVKFEKYLRSPILKNICERLLLNSQQFTFFIFTNNFFFIVQLKQ